VTLPPIPAWSELLSAALIGTDRTAPPDADADPAAALLDRAAWRTVARRAGRLPERVPAVPEAAADERPVVGPAAARRLARLLAEPSPEMLAEWLDTATARGLQPPQYLLPALLDNVSRVVATRALTRKLAAAGWARVDWLAGLNPAWAALNTRIDSDSWKFGNTATRRNYLAQLRAADPEAARKLTAAEWDTANAAERMMLLSVLDDELSLDDEPVLEAALEDRAADVHTMAAYLLSQLPRSNLGARMARRAGNCVVLQRSGPGKWLVVTPPSAFDPAMRRDGIPARPATARARRLGDRAHWLLEIVARTPLSWWTESFGLPAFEVINLRIQNDWAAVLFAGWVRAATLQRDEAWAGVLLNHALAWRMPLEAMENDALTHLAYRSEAALGGPGAAVRPMVDAPPELHAVAAILRFRYQMHKELDDDGN
jgi:hypothetical protein